jgi:hydroxymethylbilane synthase
MPARSTVRIGTRASRLARWQADWVAQRLQSLGHAVEIILLSSAGDRSQQGPLAQFGGVGAFTKEIQLALLDGAIDLAVHSLKDLPTEPVDGLTIAAVPPRGPWGDALVAAADRPCRVDDLPRGALIGTGSLRRRAQLLHVRPDLQVADVRGNVETRLAKLDAGDFDALVLAEAGLTRLELAHRMGERLSTSVMLPAIGQGALAIESRAGDLAQMIAARLDDPSTSSAVAAERSLLSTLAGGCLAPIGGLASVEGDQLHLAARVVSPDGRERLDAERTGMLADAIEIGRLVGDDLLARGADRLIRQARDAR